MGTNIIMSKIQEGEMSLEKGINRKIKTLIVTGTIICISLFCNSLVFAKSPRYTSGGFRIDLRKLEQNMRAKYGDAIVEGLKSLYRIDNSVIHGVPPGMSKRGVKNRYDFYKNQYMKVLSEEEKKKLNTYLRKTSEMIQKLTPKQLPIPDKMPNDVNNLINKRY